MTFSWWTNLLSLGGSSVNTSKAACATTPESRAFSKASSSMTPPRATLMIRTPFFIFEKVSSLKTFEVVGVSGIWSEMKSAVEMA